MSSVWDDPEFNDEEATPLPEFAPAAAPELPLEAERIEALAAEVIEKVTREILPELAERIIREHLDQLLRKDEAE